MRFSSPLLLLAIGLLSFWPSATTAQEMSDQTARIVARRELALAKAELRHYWQVEYPRQQRHLNAAIRLTEQEIRDYRQQLRMFGPFARYSLGQPLLVTEQQIRQCLVDAELRLQDLWAERNNLVRFHSDEWRIREIKVQDARLRVAEIEAELEAERAEVELEEPIARR